MTEREELCRHAGWTETVRRERPQRVEADANTVLRVFKTAGDCLEAYRRAVAAEGEAT